MKKITLSRSVGVTVTPFDDKGYPDYGEIQNQTEAFCTCPTEAILPCASTGVRSPGSPRRYAASKLLST